MGLEIIKGIYKKKTEEREKLRKEFLKRVFEALKKLSEDVSFEDAYLFGSVTEENRFSGSSDIDIAFKNLDRDRLFYAVSFLSTCLGRDVNVVHLEDIHFKDKIMKEGIRWKRD